MVRVDRISWYLVVSYVVSEAHPCRVVFRSVNTICSLYFAGVSNLPCSCSSHANLAKSTNWLNPYCNLWRFWCVVANNLVNGSVFAMIWYESETMYLFLRWRPLGCAPFSTFDTRDIVISYYFNFHVFRIHHCHHPVTACGDSDRWGTERLTERVVLAATAYLVGLFKV